ncbi:hypothetical protein R1sor_021600 [Riccia sorocarpa]|uniref:Uncharacterized protein n=1 Tax=Riccia sorocarpa TaxID=122646 RepID=A0ABD3GJN9_9MARC
MCNSLKTSQLKPQIHEVFKIKLTHGRKGPFKSMDDVAKVAELEAWIDAKGVETPAEVEPPLAKALASTLHIHLEELTEILPANEDGGTTAVLTWTKEECESLLAHVKMPMDLEEIHAS